MQISSSPKGWGIRSLNLKDLADFLVHRVLNVNTDKHHLFLEIFCNILYGVKVILRGFLVCKEDKMFVPIVTEDRLPVVGLELDHMGAGVKSHKLGQTLDTELSLENLLQYFQ